MKSFKSALEKIGINASLKEVTSSERLLVVGSRQFRFVKDWQHEDRLAQEFAFTKFFIEQFTGIEFSAEDFPINVEYLIDRQIQGSHPTLDEVEAALYTLVKPIEEYFKLIGQPEKSKAFDFSTSEYSSNIEGPEAFLSHDRRKFTYFKDPIATTSVRLDYSEDLACDKVQYETLQYSEMRWLISSFLLSVIAVLEQMGEFSNANHELTNI